MLSRLTAAWADRYRIEQELGRGGMATVYLARDLKYDRLVAVKVLHPDLAAEYGPERFLREIQVTAKLQHPHILPVLDSGKVEGEPNIGSPLLWYTMPYVEGESLRQRLHRERQLPVSVALRIASQVAEALDCAHAHGIIHRDIKPENILLSRGHALVADFGIAKAITAEAEHLTKTGLAIGTPAYMSPEQATGSHGVDARSDIYSVGCVLYEMLAGEPPFTGSTAQAMVAKVLGAPAPSVRRVRHDAPAGLDQLLERALASTPGERIASAGDLASAIDALEERHRQETTRSFWSRMRVRAAALAFGATAAGLGYVFLSPYLHRPPPQPDLPKLVVLPFDNLGPEEERYFVSGITEEITSRLGGVAGLRVIARTSANQYQKGDKTIPEIGKELRADYALVGSVRWDRDSPAAGRVRVNARLLRIPDGFQLWSEAYDAVLAGIFQVQTEIAEKVTQGLHVTLLEPDRRRLAAQPTSNLEAYDYYLRGQQHFEGWVERDLRLAVQLFERATKVDPRFAIAHAALARAHAKLYWQYYDRTPTRLAKAKVAAERALSLGPNLPEAHLAMGYYYYWGGLDYGRALQEFEIARGGDPSNSDLFLAIASVERRQGKYAKAAVNFETALELDPRSVEKAEGLGVTYYYMRRYADAERTLNRAITLGPAQYQLYGLKTLVYLSWRGDRARAAAVLREASEGIPVQELVDQLLPYFGVAFFRVLDSALGPDFHRALDHASLGPFGSDTSWYLLVRASWSHHRGRGPLAQTYFDSAKVFLEGKVRSDSTDARAHSDLGLAYAGLGRKSEAVREGELGKELMPISKEALAAVDLIESLAQIYLMVDQPDHAIAQLETLLANPGPMSPAWLSVDPRWNSLRGNPKFDRLLERGPSVTSPGLVISGRTS
jgi:serine/threonine-protein kinase